MKTVKVTTTTVKTIELPKYFKSTHYKDSYFMILDEKNYIRFFHRPYDPVYADGPEFMINRVEFISGWAEKGYEAMCEQDFLEIFSETLMLINEIVNNHVKN
jgi:hypothetical protein